jgi:hypothetical protein
MILQARSGVVHSPGEFPALGETDEFALIEKPAQHGGVLRPLASRARREQNHLRRSARFAASSMSGPSMRQARNDGHQLALPHQFN